jgi:hypothetical protein
MFGNDKYLEQWERTQRWYSKVKKIQNGVDNSTSDKDCLDIVYAFFLNCYHLKDWVKWCLTDCREKRKIEDLFDKCFGDEVFKMCADLANKSKHLEIYNKRIKGGAEIVSQNVAIGIKQPASEINWVPPDSKYSWIIQGGDEKLNAYLLADKLMERWKKVLESIDTKR